MTALPTSRAPDIRRLRAKKPHLRKIAVRERTYVKVY
jgi:hypothetical protein